MTLDYAAAPVPPADAPNEPRLHSDLDFPSLTGRGDEACRAGVGPTGPRTPEGKETSSHNATTYGLFARETVLPQHWEDPTEYAKLWDELTQDLRPQNLLERHCVQTIADSLWRLRRFHQWNAHFDQDNQLTQDDRLKKMERAQRAETTLHRRINTALQMLGRDLSELLRTRARLPHPNPHDQDEDATTAMNNHRSKLRGIA